MCGMMCVVYVGSVCCCVSALLSSLFPLERCSIGLLRTCFVGYHRLYLIQNATLDFFLVDVLSPLAQMEREFRVSQKKKGKKEIT